MIDYIPTHLSVLTKAVEEFAFPPTGEVFVDATFGLGGHTRVILNRFPGIRKVIAIDRDAEILDFSCESLKDERIMRFQANASDIAGILPLAGEKSVDGILVDLGVSSYQLDKAERGFSFTRPGPLDMRMNQDQALTATEIVNNYEKSQLVRIFREFGEENFSGRIADAILREREKEKITTTDRLASIISAAIPGKFKSKNQIHPATRVFQAIRIEVNNELDELEKFLEVALSSLKTGGHLCVISFHSLEDRIVKKFLQKHQKGCVCPPSFPVCRCNQRPELEILTRKAVFADEEETAANPRSRSARLRAAKRIKAV